MCRSQLKILMLTSLYYPTVGGTQNHVERISSNLSIRNNHVVIIAEKKPSHLKSREVVNNILVCRAPLRQMRYLFFLPYLLLSILECLRFNPQIIHAHFAFPPGLIAILLSKVFRKPCLITVHGVDVLKDQEARYGLRLMPIMDSLIKLILNQASLVISCSKFVRNIIENMGVSKNKIVVIPNGVDNIEQKFRLSKNYHNEYKADLGFLQDQVILFSARRLVLKNGLHYLIKAMEKISTHKTDVILIIAGDGPLRNQLIKMINRLNLKKNVRLLGEINPSELERLYVASDIIVLPSLIEAFGIIVLESMAYSKPIISFDSGGPTELINQNKNGLIVENRNIQQLTESILHLIHSPSLIINLKNNADRNVRKYDWNNVTNVLLSYYYSLK